MIKIRHNEVKLNNLNIKFSKNQNIIIFIFNIKIILQKNKNYIKKIKKQI